MSFSFFFPSDPDVRAEGAETCRFFPILLEVHTGHMLCDAQALGNLGKGPADRRGGAKLGSLRGCSRASEDLFRPKGSQGFELGFFSFLFFFFSPHVLLIGMMRWRESLKSIASWG